MSGAYAAKLGSLWTVVRAGMAEHHVEIGQGATLRAAFADLDATPLQSVGRCPEETALSWARHAWGSDQVPPWADFEAVDEPSNEEEER